MTFFRTFHGFLLFILFLGSAAPAQARRQGRWNASGPTAWIIPVVNNLPQVDAQNPLSPALRAYAMGLASTDPNQVDDDFLVYPVAKELRKRTGLNVLEFMDLPEALQREHVIEGLKHAEEKAEALAREWVDRREMVEDVFFARREISRIYLLYGPLLGKALRKQLARLAVEIEALADEKEAEIRRDLKAGRERQAQALLKNLTRAEAEAFRILGEFDVEHIAGPGDSSQESASDFAASVIRPEYEALSDESSSDGLTDRLSALRLQSAMFFGRLDRAYRKSVGKRVDSVPAVQLGMWGEHEIRYLRPIERILKKSLEKHLKFKIAATQATKRFRRQQATYSYLPFLGLPHLAKLASTFVLWDRSLGAVSTRERAMFFEALETGDDNRWLPLSELDTYAHESRSLRFQEQVRKKALYLASLVLFGGLFAYSADSWLPWLPVLVTLAFWGRNAFLARRFRSHVEALFRFREEAVASASTESP